MGQQEHDAALTYIAWGWRVLPVAPDSKRAIMKGSAHHEGHTDTLKPETAHKWFLEEFPDARIGLHMGDRSGIVIIDIDNDDALEQAQQMGLLDWSTRIVKTRRGYHFYYRPHRPGIRHPETFAPGVDFLRHTRLAVAPPSDGYTVWADNPVKPLPQAAIDIIEQSAHKKKSAQQKAQGSPKTAQEIESSVSVEDAVAETSESHPTLALALANIRAARKGRRHDTLLRWSYTVGRRVGAGELSDEYARVRLIDAGLEADQENAEQVVDDGLEHGKEHPKRSTDLQTVMEMKTWGILTQGPEMGAKPVDLKVYATLCSMASAWNVLTPNCSRRLVSEWSGIPEATVGRALNRLEKLNLIAREKPTSPSDSPDGKPTDRVLSSVCWLLETPTPSSPSFVGASWSYLPTPNSPVWMDAHPEALGSTAWVLYALIATDTTSYSTKSIASRTRIDRKTARKALSALQKAELIARDGQVWVATEKRPEEALSASVALSYQDRVQQMRRERLEWHRIADRIKLKEQEHRPLDDDDLEQMRELAQKGRFTHPRLIRDPIEQRYRQEIMDEFIALLEADERQAEDSDQESPVSSEPQQPEGSDEWVPLEQTLVATPSHRSRRPGPIPRPDANDSGAATRSASDILSNLSELTEAQR